MAVTNVLNMTLQKPYMSYSFTLHHTNAEKRCNN